MAVGKEEVEVPVEVGVEERRAPSHPFEGRSRQPGGLGRVLEEAVAEVPVQRVAVVREVGDDEVQPAVSVVVARVHAHAGLGAAVPAERDPAEQAHAFEAAIAAVVVQEVRVRVVGDVEVRPPVVVVVGRHHAQSPGRGRILQAASIGDLCEGAVAPVLVVDVGGPRQPHGADHDPGPSPPRHRAPRVDDVVPAHVGVAHHVEVEVPVPVAVEERAAGAPAPGAHARRLRHVGEGPVPVVPEEEVRAEVRDVEIEEPVAVEVAGADAVAPGRRIHTRRARDVLELPVPEVVVEGVAVGDPLSPVVELEGAHGIDVEPPVVVVVEEGYAAAARFEEVVLRASPTEGLLRQGGHFLELDRRRPSLRTHALRRRAHRGSVAAIDRLLHLRLAVAALERKVGRRPRLEHRAQSLEDAQAGFQRERSRRPAGLLAQTRRGVVELAAQLGSERGHAGQGVDPSGRFLQEARGLAPPSRGGGVRGPPEQSGGFPVHLDQAPRVRRRGQTGRHRDGHDGREAREAAGHATACPP